MTVWNEISIKELLDRSDKAVIAALQALWQYQTIDEQRIGEAKELNDVGYNKPDSMTAKFYIGLIEDNQHLYPKQINKLRFMLKKYAKQLARIANLNELKKEALNVK